METVNNTWRKRPKYGNDERLHRDTCLQLGNTSFSGRFVLCQVHLFSVLFISLFYIWWSFNAVFSA